MLQANHSDHTNVVPFIKGRDKKKSSLTSKELMVLKHINLSNDEIADLLNKSPNTIKNHLKKIREKLNIKGSPRSDLLAYAIKIYGWEAVMGD